MKRSHRAGLIGFGMMAGITLMVSTLAISVGKPKQFNLLSAFLLSGVMGSAGAAIGVIVFFFTGNEEEEPSPRSPLALSPGPQPLDIVREAVGPDLHTQVGAGTAFTALTGGGNTVQTAELFRESRLFMAQITGGKSVLAMDGGLPDPEPAIQAVAYEYGYEEPEPAQPPAPERQAAPALYGQEPEDIWADPVPQGQSSGVATVSAWE